MLPTFRIRTSKKKPKRYPNLQKLSLLTINCKASTKFPSDRRVNIIKLLQAYYLLDRA